MHTAVQGFEVISKPWDCTHPVPINGRQYRLTESGPNTSKDGTRLWPVSIALASYVDDLLLNQEDLTKRPDRADRTVCELGGGLGLVSIVAASRWARCTLIEKDQVTCKYAEDNIAANYARVTVRCEEWADSKAGPFDYIFGSEIVYKNYGIPELIEFVDREWTRRGACVFMSCSDKDREIFEDSVTELNLIAEIARHHFRLPCGRDAECHVWRVLP